MTGSFTDADDYINNMTGGAAVPPQHIFGFWDNRTGSAAVPATVASRYSSLWKYNHSVNGGQGVAPTSTPANPTKATQGAVPFTNPSGGRKLFLVGHDAVSSQIGALVLFNRLAHVGGLSGTVTTAQTAALSSSRYTYANSNAAGNQLFIEINTQIGATATTAIVNYTNQANTGSRVSKEFSIGGTGLREDTRWIPVVLQDGDTGVEATASVDLVATTGTAGDFALVMARPILVIPVIAAGGMSRDTLSGNPALPEIKTDDCLFWAFLAQVTTAPQILAGLHLAET